MNKKKRIIFLNAALKALLAAVDTSAIIKGTGTFITEVASGLKDEERNALIEAKEEDIKTFSDDQEMKKLFDRLGGIENFISEVMQFQVQHDQKTDKILEQTQEIKTKQEEFLEKENSQPVLDIIDKIKKEYTEYNFRSNFEWEKNGCNSKAKPDSISGKDAVVIFCECLQRVIECNISSGRALQEHSLDSTFPDGIIKNLRDLDSLLINIVCTIEFCEDSHVLRLGESQFLFEYSKLKRFLNDNLIGHKERFVVIEEKLLPQAIDLVIRDAGSAELQSVLDYMCKINQNMIKIDQYIN